VGVTRAQAAQTAIAVANPKAAAGMARLRRAAEESDAIPPEHAALVTACAAAARGEAVTAHEALKRAFGYGLPSAQAWAATAVLLLARGEAAAGRLAEALIEVFGPPQPVGPYHGGFDSEDALSYVREYYGGEVPLRVALLAERSPIAFEGWALLHRSALRDGPLPAVLAELILCGVNAADYQGSFVAVHANSARRIGASDQAIADALVAVIPLAGASAWPAAEVLMPARDQQ